MHNTPEDNIVYDVVIIGSGLGGLLCAYVLSDEGYKVCILEKNNQPGGSLQTFVRNKCVLDTGIHYIGGLEEGQPLNSFFKYFGLMDQLKVKKLDVDGFERISFGDGSQVYRYGMGYDGFKKIMLQQFPEEENAIDTYCRDIRDICLKFPMYNADAENEIFFEVDLLSIGVVDYLKKLTDNVVLQNVLAATNLLYAGIAHKTPLYVHALVVNSYIESAYRLPEGGGQITRLLMNSIRKKGGVLFKYAEVDYIHVEEEAKYVSVKDGRIFRGKNFIANIHPAALLDILETDKIRKAYKKRIQQMENTISIFVLNIVLKKNTISYQNYNLYHHENIDVWSSVDYTPEQWPSSYAIYYPVPAGEETFVNSITVMAYMKYDEVKKWEHTFNTKAKEGKRGEDYEQFKNEKAARLIALASRNVPGLAEAVEHCYVSTPLTYRDYIGNKDGSLYGILKDYSSPLSTFLSPRTKVKNLLLTGQNLHVHGVYGVSVSAIKTCSELLGNAYLMQKIGKYKV